MHFTKIKNGVNKKNTASRNIPFSSKFGAKLNISKHIAGFCIVFLCLVFIKYLVLFNFRKCKTSQAPYRKLIRNRVQQGRFYVCYGRFSQGLNLWLHKRSPFGTFGAVQHCRSTTVPKMKTLFNSAENLNKFQHMKCGNQKLNSDSLQS